MRDRGEPGAVVVGLNPAGLGIVRSLGRRRIPVLGIDSDLSQPSARTRYCEKVFCPDVNGSPLVETLSTLGTSLDVAPVLFTSGDLCVNVVSDHREELQKYYKFLLPDRTTVDMLLSKRLFGIYAIKNGLPVPQTFCAGDEDGIRRIAGTVNYPCIVKPTFRNPQWERSVLPKTFVVNDQDALLDVYRRISGLQNDVIIQEWVPGPDSEIHFCLMYFNEAGTPVVHFEGRKIFQWPPTGGSTAVAEGIACDDVRDESMRFFESIRFKGMGSVEFKRDPRDGRFKIMEPTVGRPNLQSDVATACGVNIPGVVYDDLAGREPSCRRVRKAIGARWIYEENAFDLIAHRGQYGLTLRTVCEALRGQRAYALWARDDLRPSLAFVTAVARRIIRFLWSPKKHHQTSRLDLHMMVNLIRARRRRA